MRRVFVLVLMGMFACGDDDGPIDVGPLSDGSPTPDARFDGGPGFDSGPLDGGTDSAFDGGPMFDGGPEMDAGRDPDAGSDAGASVGFPAEWPQGRGWNWVRTNETFVSALTVRMGAPTVSGANMYFDDFNATAAHLWQTGMPVASDGWESARPGSRWLTWVDQFGNSSSNNMFLGGSPRAPGLIGYQISDEPRTRARFDEILAAAARIAGADPGPLRILNITYQAADSAAWMREACAAGHIDLLSYDRYSYGNGQFETMMMVRDVAQECGIPYWRYLDSYEHEVNHTPTGMRWDAFSGLLAGYTGHSWFLYASNEGFASPLLATAHSWDSARGRVFDAAASINHDLVVYGQAQTRLRSTAVGWHAHSPVTGLHPPDGFPRWTTAMGGDAYLSTVETSGHGTGFLAQTDVVFGFFEDRFHDTYVMVFNPNHEEGAVPNDGAYATRVTLGFDFSSAPAGTSTDHLQVLRADGTLENLPISDEHVTLNIPAAEIVFYKYDTGRGFEGYR